MKAKNTIVFWGVHHTAWQKYFDISENLLHNSSAMMMEQVKSLLNTSTILQGL